MSRRSLSILLTACLVSLVCYQRNSQDPHARYVAAAYEEIDHHALFQPDDQELVSGAMRGMVEVLRGRGDEHSGYSDPTDAERFMADIRQEFGGVGVRIRFKGEPPRLTLIGPPEPDTPAARAGLLAGDRLDAIDGAPTDELGMEEVLDLMRGPIGETVVLTVSRGGAADAETLTVPLVRAAIELPSVIGDRREPSGRWRHLLDEAPRVALVRITSFGNKTARELRGLIPGLLDRGAEALVLDLRNNPGGALDVAIDTCNLFLPRGKRIVETRGRNRRVLAREVSRGGPYPRLPLAVLINGESASAAEIVAACLQDNDRAVVIGERSFGKGTVQQLLPTESGRTLLKLTVASYWRPSGANIHRMPGDSADDPWGVRPDPGFGVALTDEQLLAWREGRAERDLTPVGAPVSDEAQEASAWDDAVLNRAVEHLTGQLAG